MALQELNTFKDLAREWNNVSVETVRRWFKKWGIMFDLTVKRPSERTILIPKAEAERFWKLVDTKWDILPDEEKPALTQAKPQAKRAAEIPVKAVKKKGKTNGKPKR